MKVPVQLPPMAEPKRSAPSIAPTRAQSGRSGEMDQAQGVLVRDAIVQRATQPATVKPAVDGGYGDLIAATQAPASPAATPTGGKAGDERAAVTPEDEQAMRADVDFLVAKLREELLTQGEEREMLACIERWDARDLRWQSDTRTPGTPYLDRLLFLLKTRTFTRSTASSGWIEQHVNAFDELWRELEDDRLTRFAAIVSHSHKQAASGPSSGPAENFWKTMGKQEAMGGLGFVKGLVMGATGLADAGAGGITAVLKSIPGLGEHVAEAPKVAEWFGQQYDYMGRQAFGKDWDAKLLGNMSAGDIGTKGGQLVWGLVMIGAGNQLQAGAKGMAGATSVMPALEGAARVQRALAVIGTLGSFKGVRESATGMMAVVDRLQAQGKLSAANLLTDQEFLQHAVGIAGAVYGAVSGGGNTGSAERWAATRIGALFEVANVAVHLKAFVDISNSDDPPHVKAARQVDVISDIALALYRAVAQVAGMKDMQSMEAAHERQKAQTAASKAKTTAEPPAPAAEKEVVEKLQEQKPQEQELPEEAPTPKAESAEVEVPAPKAEPTEAEAPPAPKAEPVEAEAPPAPKQANEAEAKGAKETPEGGVASKDRPDTLPEMVAKEALEHLRRARTAKEAEMESLQRQREALRQEYNKATKALREALEERTAAVAKNDVKALQEARERSLEAQQRANSAREALDGLPDDAAFWAALKKLDADIEVEGIKADPNSRGALPCFAAETLVWTPLGPRPISELQPGDEVWTYDSSTDTHHARPILQCHRGRTDAFYCVRTEAGTVRATSQHRFWVDSDAAWRTAESLEPGMRLRKRGFGQIVILDVDRESSPDDATFNLSIEEHHTYFVGPGALVHNAAVDVRLGSGFVIYRATNPKYPDMVYIGQTTELDARGKPRGTEARQTEHQTTAGKKLEGDNRAIQPLSPENKEFYEFMEGATLEPIVKGIATQEQADYLEQRNIDIERKIHGEGKVMNRRNQITSASHMKEVEDRIKADAAVQATGHCQ